MILASSCPTACFLEVLASFQIPLRPLPLFGGNKGQAVFTGNGNGPNIINVKHTLTRRGI